MSLPPCHSLLCVDELVQYQPFFSDFGPIHLGSTARFCAEVDALLALSPAEVVYVHCTHRGEAKSNAAVLMGIYAVWRLQLAAADAYEPLRAFEPYIPFRDASTGPHTYHLKVTTHTAHAQHHSVFPAHLPVFRSPSPLRSLAMLAAAVQPLDCISAFAVALRVGLFDAASWSQGGVAEYEHFEQVEHGDLNVVCPGRFLAFASPAAPPPASSPPPAYPPFEPRDYLPIFRHFHVRVVIRLNHSSYSPLPFTSHGIRHVDMPFPDGANPPASIVRRFLAVVDEQEEVRGGGVVAVHCKAGLGRTGSLLGCWLMREYGMRASEAIAWLRLCRPGSVIGNQQDWLEGMEEQMHREGHSRRLRRLQHSPSPKPDSSAKAAASEEHKEADDEPVDAKAGEVERAEDASAASAASLSVGFEHQANGLLAMKAMRAGRKATDGEGKRGSAASAVHPMTTRMRAGLQVGDKRRVSLPTSSVFRVQRAGAVWTTGSPHAATARAGQVGGGEVAKQGRGSGRQQQGRAALQGELKWRQP